MSKCLVAFYNETNETVLFKNLEDTKNDRKLPKQSMFTTKVHFNIPDNSDSSEYFDAHHMELQKEDGTTILSFWDDDDAKYVMFFCDGKNWNVVQCIPGFNQPGDKTDVALVLTRNGTAFELHSRFVQALV